MVFGWETLNEVSLVALIDGADCSKEESVMGYWGLIIWISLAIYLMVGQFVICEEYFVPILSQLGDRWKMAEDVQGATLLAVGSSSPELFTALLGVIFYPDDNPGPGTNVGSAVFNMCVIVGLSAIFAPRAAKLSIVPFLRDSIAYMIGLIELYIFYSIITPGSMDIWESILLTAWWILYVFAVYRTDLLATRCCCCVPQSALDKTIKEIELNTVTDIEKTGGNYVALGGHEDDEDLIHRPSFLKQPSVFKKNQKGKIGVLYDKKGHPVSDFEQNPDNIRIAPGAMTDEAIDEDLQKLLDELNRKQRQNVNKGWVVVVMPTEDANKLHFPTSSSNNIGSIQLSHQHSGSGHGDIKIKSKSHAYVRRRTLIETLAHERDAAEAAQSVAHQHGDGDDDDDDEQGHSRGAVILHKFLKPWTKIFSWTLPSPEGSFATKHIYLTILAIIAWLGILTFFVVDCSEKIGQCFNIPGGLLGITLLAVGSSLPDCISSIIVARQMKIDMAVANAFGSNIFDVNLCVGFSFILGSIAKAAEGESTSISLGDGHALQTFSELIIAAAGFMVFLWLMIWCTLFRLERWIGYVLSLAYVGYICVFTVLFVHDQDAGDDFGEG